MADFFISVPRLAEHQALCREERLLAEALQNEVRRLGQADNLAADDRYRQLVRKTNKLYDYTREITRVTDYLDDEAGQLLRRIHMIMRDAAETAREASRFDFTL